MTSSLAAQLAQIAAKSKISLDVKAQKAAHAQSLLFEPRVAAGQSFSAVYAVCRDGFDELCQLDERFGVFGQTLFSALSVDEERTQLTAAENAELDRQIESFLRLSGSKLRLLPAIKSMEWLIRRFRIHEYNTLALITTFLPYHGMPAFVTLMSILPAQLPHEYGFLRPYVKSQTAPPRAAIVQQAAQHFELVATLSAYTLAAGRAQQHYAGLVAFWGGVLTETVNAMLDAGRSGRRALQAARDAELLQRVGPIVGDALVLRAAPGVQLAAYMAVAVLAAKATTLGDAAVAALMEQLVAGWSGSAAEVLPPGLACLAMLAQRRSAKQLSQRVARAVLRVPDLAARLVGMARQGQRVDRLASGLVLALTERLARKAGGSGGVRSLPTIRALLQGGVLQEKQLAVAFKALLVAAHRLAQAAATAEKTDDKAETVRRELGAMLVVLAQGPAAAGGDVIRRVIDEVQMDMEELELMLDAPAVAALPDAAEATSATTAAAGREEDADGEAALQRLAQLPRPTSWLQTDAGSADGGLYDGLYDGLTQALLAAVAHGAERLARLDQAAVLGRATALSATDCFYQTFCVRVWCSGTLPVLARVAALEMVARRLREASGAEAETDVQALLPYCLVALSDPAKKVRQAAAQLVATIGAGEAVKTTATTATKKKTTTTTPWGTGLYSGDVAWLTAEARNCLLEVLAASLDEAVLDRQHLAAALAEVLAGKREKSESGGDTKKRSHGVRLAMLAFLASHTVHTPLLAAKIRLLAVLNQVGGSVGGSAGAATTRTALLLPVLEQWAGLDAAAARQWAAREGVDEAAMDESSVAVVVANDARGRQALLALVDVNGAAGRARAGLVQQAFARIRALWPAMKEEARFATAQFMLSLARSGGGDNNNDNDNNDTAAEAAALLQEVPLSTATLAHFLDGVQAEAARVASAAGGAAWDGPLRSALGYATFVLQLVHGAQPAAHPALLQQLFAVLAALQQLRGPAGSELGYLHSLVLGSLLAMMPAYEADRRLKIAASVGHGDVLVRCVHTSTSAAVQNEALLLVARLARTAPDVVLHSIMPLFTQTGASSVLRHSDEYSAQVLAQTIRAVIPPLMGSLASGRSGGRTATATARLLAVAPLLASFVQAYEHIPPHRRRELFGALAETLGPEEYLFALVGMLADRYGGAADTTAAFVADLMGAFGVEVQLPALIRLVALVADAYSAKPQWGALWEASPEGGSDGATAAPAAAARILALLPQLLANPRLRADMAALDAADDDMRTAKTRELYAQLLADLLAVAETVRQNRSAGGSSGRCGEAVAQLLDLLSMAEFLKAVETLLDRPGLAVRQKVLRALEDRVGRASQSDAAARTALLAFLPQLTAVIRAGGAVTATAATASTTTTPPDTPYIHTAMACVDRIAEKYGRRDLEAVSAAAAAMAGNNCLGAAADRRLRVMALLCLSSLTDVLQDAMVPVLAAAMPRALAALESSFGTSASAAADPELHNAVYAFIAALAEHLPYMLAGSLLDRLLEASFCAAAATDRLGAAARATRVSCLQLLARQVDAKALFDVLQRKWPLQGMEEYIIVLTAAIDHHGRAAIRKNLPALAAIFQRGFDLRREASAAAEPALLAAMPEREAALNTAALHMVLKLRDSLFRPVFADWAAWADNGGLPRLDVHGRCQRQQGFYAFLLLFFDRLGAAVTSYAAYLLDGAAAALRTARVATSAEDRALWTRVLQVLGAAMGGEDGDDDDEGAPGTSDASFWQTPAHFAVAHVLVEQFGRARELAHASQTALLATHLTPTVVRLARAAHAPDHRKELNTLLLKRLRSPHAAERLAVVQCQQALAEQVGEDWLALLPEMLPYMSELQDDDDEAVDRETHRWIATIEGVLGESLDTMLQ